MAQQPIVYKTVEEGLDGAPPWITTFVDMTSLLVTFFILLFTFSSIRDFDAFTYPLNILGTSGTLEKNPPANDVSALNDDVMSAMDIRRGARVPHSRPLDQLDENLEEMGQKLTEDRREVDMADVGDGLRMRFDADAGFKPGGSTLSPALERALAELADVMEHYPHVLVVEGFTDAAFRPTQEHPDAESLSLARAEAAARLLSERYGIAPERIQVVGRGHVPLPGNTDADLAQRSANRRVEVRVMAISEALQERYEEGPR